MFTLIAGGSASGKSSYAEALAVRQCGARIYLATMQPMDTESMARIAKHRKMRADKNFTTIEHYIDIGKASIPRGANVLLECMSNLVANERYCPDGAGENAEESIVQGIEKIAQKCANIIIVTCDVCGGGAAYDDDTCAYLRQLAQINRTLAKKADIVIEVVAGLPNVLKGIDALQTIIAG